MSVCVCKSYGKISALGKQSAICSFQSPFESQTMKEADVSKFKLNIAKIYFLPGICEVGITILGVS